MTAVDLPLTVALAGSAVIVAALLAGSGDLGEPVREPAEERHRHEPRRGRAEDAAPAAPKTEATVA